MSRVLDELVKRSVNRNWITDVGGRDGRGDAVVSKLGRDRLEALPIAGNEPDRMPFSSESPGNGRTDTAGPAPTTRIGPCCCG